MCCAMAPENILPTYEAVADGWDRNRNRTLFERAWLDRMLAAASGRRVLDLGCGSGRPIGTYLHDRRPTIKERCSRYLQPTPLRTPL